MGSARVQGIMCGWRDFSNCLWGACDCGVKGRWWIVLCYLRREGFDPFISSSLSGNWTYRIYVFL